MGDIANQLVEDEMFGVPYVDETERQTRFCKRTPSEMKIASIRKEIAIAVKNGMELNEARKQANVKYGKGWRERGLVSNSNNQWSEEDLKPYLTKQK